MAMIPHISSLETVHHSRQEYVQADMSTKHSPKHSIERGILEITATSDNKSNKRKLTRPTPSMNENLQPVKSRTFINSKYTKQPTSKSKNEHENKRQPLVNKKYRGKNYIHDYQPWKERPVQIKKSSKLTSGPTVVVVPAVKTPQPLAAHNHTDSTPTALINGHVAHKRDDLAAHYHTGSTPTARINDHVAHKRDNLAAHNHTDSTPTALINGHVAHKRDDLAAHNHTDSTPTALINGHVAHKRDDLAAHYHTGSTPTARINDHAAHKRDNLAAHNHIMDPQANHTAGIGQTPESDSSQLIAPLTVSQDTATELKPTNGMIGDISGMPSDSQGSTPAAMEVMHTTNIPLRSSASISPKHKQTFLAVKMPQDPKK